MFIQTSVFNETDSELIASCISSLAKNGVEKYWRRVVLF